MSEDIGMHETVRLGSVRMENFRCFKECTFELHPDVTVFVADNGKGKTSILDGIRLLLEMCVKAVVPEADLVGIREEDIRWHVNEHDVREVCLPTFASTTSKIYGSEVSWEHRRTSVSRKTQDRHQETDELLDAVASAGKRMAEAEISMPLLAHYEATRTARIPDGKDAGPTMSVSPNRITGYDDCFQPIGSFARFVNWYQSASESLEKKSVFSKTINYARLLASVNDAVDVVLAPTSWTRLHWNYQGSFLQVEHKDGRRLPASVMSDGVRTTLAIVADIAHRCCRLNPHLEHEARLKTSGVVLIDEIDLHLHPGWQQQIVDLLREAFPRLQFVMTTHSPQVLSALDNESIRIVQIQDGIANITTPEYQTRGVESADILARIMGIDPIPKVPEAGMVRRYRSFIEDRLTSSDDARAVWDELIGHFKATHPVIKELERLERFFTFKDKRKEGGKE